MKVSRAKHRRGAGRRRPGLPALEWAEDMSGRCARATIVVGHSVLVENHTGILGFCESSILLGSRTGPICVTGSGLSLRDARPGCLVIRGDIRRVELPCAGGDAPDEE